MVFDKLPSPAYAAGQIPLHLILSFAVIVFVSACVPTKSLVMSAGMGDTRAVENALKNDADVDAKGKYGNTALHDASFSGHEEIVRLLLEYGADTNIRGRVGLVPLHSATMGGHLEIMRLLLANGADVDRQSDNGYTALHFAAENGETAILQLLIDNGASVDKVSEGGLPPLHLASRKGQVDALRVLLKNGANVMATDEQGKSALHMAAGNDHSEVVVMLIDAGAPLNVKDHEGRTPLALAEANKNQGVARILKNELLAQGIGSIQKGTPDNTGNDDSGSTGLSATMQQAPGVSPDAYGPYHALVIGNNEYRHLHKLNTATHDASSIADLLKEKYGFDVKLMTNATRSDILLALYSYRKKLTDKDNFLIYYAGHGWLDKDADQGYWLPIDAEKDNPILWVSNASITSEIRANKAKHIMVVVDSCYSGKIARGVQVVDMTRDYLKRMSGKRTRVVLSSGGLEPVLDSGGKDNHSVFASAFIDTLSENAGVLDGASLFTMVREKVGWNADQIPEYAVIHKAGHDGGDFLFLVNH